MWTQHTKFAAPAREPETLERKVSMREFSRADMHACPSGPLVDRGSIVDWVTAALPPRGTRVADLTEPQRLALAFAAGVQVDMVRHSDGDRFEIRTREAVGFVLKDDGTYAVVATTRYSKG